MIETAASPENQLICFSIECERETGSGRDQPCASARGRVGRYARERRGGEQCHGSVEQHLSAGITPEALPLYTYENAAGILEV